MNYRFVEVFRENVPIAVRLQDLLKYVDKARELKCYEMRIIVSFDQANPGIDLIFGRLIINDRLKAGGFFPDFDYKVHAIPGIDISDKSTIIEDSQSHISDALCAQFIRTLGWLEAAKELPKIKHRISINENCNWESKHIETLRKNFTQKQWQSECFNNPCPEEPEILDEKNGKINNNRH